MNWFAVVYFFLLHIPLLCGAVATSHDIHTQGEVLILALKRGAMMRRDILSVSKCSGLEDLRYLSYFLSIRNRFHCNLPTWVAVYENSAVKVSIEPFLPMHLGTESKSW